MTKVDPFLLPSLPLEEKTKLPRIRCVYFAIADNEILYIGTAARSLKSRWQGGHHKEQYLIEFSPRIAWLEVDELTDILALESSLIDELKPRFNGVVPKPPAQPSKHYIAWKLNEVMAAKRVKNKQLALAIGVTETSISRMRKLDEMPRISPERLDAICVFLNCQPGDLLVRLPKKTA